MKFMKGWWLVIVFVGASLILLYLTGGSSGTPADPYDQLPYVTY